MELGWRLDVEQWPPKSQKDWQRHWRAPEMTAEKSGASRKVKCRGLVFGAQR
jgi:hypothetical protein